MQLNNLPNLKANRKVLRNNLTQAEAVLWKLLKGSQLDGRKFRRQHSIGNYIMDFYCPAEKLCIELDGDAHFTTAGNEYDTERTAYLNSNGIRVLRYENLEVLNFQENVLADIRRNFRPTAPECQSTEQFRG